MYTANYPDKRTYELFDRKKKEYFLYLNEKKIKYSESIDHGTEPVQIEGYSYSGTEPSGATKIIAEEATYPSFVAGLIRLKYSADDVEAIEANWRKAFKDPKCENADRYFKEEEDLEEYRKECKAIAKELLGL